MSEVGPSAPEARVQQAADEAYGVLTGDDDGAAEKALRRNNSLGARPLYVGDAGEQGWNRSQ